VHAARLVTSTLECGITFLRSLEREGNKVSILVSGKYVKPFVYRLPLHPTLKDYMTFILYDNLVNTNIRARYNCSLKASS
jgi:hypothetical protein